MIPDIEAIFLDVGNTLRIVVPDEEFIRQAKMDMMELVAPPVSEEAFFDTLETRWKRYRNHSKASLIEASEKELWTKWLLPDFPFERIAPLSGRLTRLWRDRDGRRVPRSDVSLVVKELARRGYVLGIIANTITETEIPDWMEGDGLTGYFKTVILSSRVGIRKPNPEIYWIAARQAGVDPGKCVYVGDNPLRDVEGCRAAGYGMMVLLHEPDTLKKETPTQEFKPDYTIKTCSDLLDIFPSRVKAVEPG
jgi:putative hydrolase of the HAD superfamily